MVRDEKGDEDVILTATLARLYEKQGLLREAAAVYKELLSVHPEQETLQNALRGIETRIRGQKPRDLSGETENVLLELERWQEVIFLKKRAYIRQKEDTVRVLMIQGPDVAAMNLGERQGRSGKRTADDMRRFISQVAEDCGMVADFFRTDSEEAMIQRICEAAKGYHLLIIDPGQPACTGRAARDALAALDLPIIEVHPLHSCHDGLCRKSGIEGVSTAYLAGFGEQTYAMAVRAGARMCRQFFEAKAMGVRRRMKGET